MHVHSRLERVVFLVNLILMIPEVKITFNDLYYTITGDSSRALRYLKGPVMNIARDWYIIVVCDVAFENNM